MNHKAALSLFGGFLVFLSTMIFLSSQTFNIVKGGDFNDASCWFTHVYFGQGANGSISTISNGRLLMVVNDTSSMQSYSRVQQGTLPHRWILFETPQLNRELTVRRFLEADDGCLWIRCTMNRSVFRYYGNGSRVNLGFILWFDVGQGYNEPIDEAKALGLDIQVYSTVYINGRVYVRSEASNSADVGYKIWMYNSTTGRYEYVQCDYDYHYYSFVFITNSTNMLQGDEEYKAKSTACSFVIDAGHHIKLALQSSRIWKAKLKDFDIFIEANNGYGAVTVNYVDLVFSPSITSPYVTIHSTLYGTLTFLVLLAALTIIEKTKRQQQRTSSRCFHQRTLTTTRNRLEHGGVARI